MNFEQIHSAEMADIKFFEYITYRGDTLMLFSPKCCKGSPCHSANIITTYKVYESST